MKRILFYGYLTGYILQIVGPIFIDPLLTTNVLYGVRTYPYVILTIPIFLILVSAEYAILNWAERTKDLYWTLVPYSVAFALTLPLFVPGFPHANVTFIYVCGLVISALAIAIQQNIEGLRLDQSALQTGGRQLVDYLKEALSLSKQIMVALLAGYAGLVITFYSRMIALNGITVSNADEVLLMSMNTGFHFGWISVYFLIGPVYCTFRTTIQLLSQLKTVVHNGALADGAATGTPVAQPLRAPDRRERAPASR